MDFFDIALTLLMFELVFNKYISQKVFTISLILSVIVSVTQIIIVGYKWQYMPFYLMIFLYSLKESLNIKLNNKFLKTITFVLVFTVFIFTSALIYFFPIPTFTPTNKNYSVGYKEVYLNIESRPSPKVFNEISTLENNTSRELMVDIYYPSAEETKPIQLVRSSVGNWGESVIKYLNRTWGINIPTFLLNHLTLSYFDVGVDITPASLKAPLVVYSHGWAGEKIFAADQLINIASQGYVVVSIDHTGLAMFTELPSGTVINTGSTEDSSDIYQVMYEMSKDVEDTLTILFDSTDDQVLLNLFQQVVDKDNVTLMGHSTGGASSVIYCQTHNCKKLILQDPYLLPVLLKDGDIAITTPAYFIYSEDWYSGYEDSEYTPEIKIYRDYINSSSEIFGYYLSESAHYDFVAFGSISPLTSYTFLKGSINYIDSLNINNYFNAAALQNKMIETSQYLKEIEK